jgi:capsular polysaccharide transport system ATP-binding protein
VITLDNVTKAYAMNGGRKVVLQDATAAFLPGHNYGVLGINGAGKSTLIRLLAGTEMPDHGRIRRHARVSFPLGFGGTFHGTLSRYSGAFGTKNFHRPANRSGPLGFGG